MAYVLKQVYKQYRYYLVDYSDPLSDDLPLASYPLAVAGIIGLYLYFVLSCGPRLMEKYEPFHIKPVLIVYNFFQIVANIFVWLYVIYWTYYRDEEYSLLCSPASKTYFKKRVAVQEITATYLFFLLKILDLIDTVFFVMRKRFNHISFLHVYHHAAMVVATYIAVRFLPAGHGTMVAVLNCLVHSLMYGYYLFSAINENVKRSIWKKHITQIQMCQFLLLGIHFAQTLFNENCNYPKLISFVMAVQNLFMLFMFGDFYRNAYLKKKHD